MHRPMIYRRVYLWTALSFYSTDINKLISGLTDIAHRENQALKTHSATRNYEITVVNPATDVLVIISVKTKMHTNTWFTKKHINTEHTNSCVNLNTEINTVHTNSCVNVNTEILLVALSDVRSIVTITAGRRHDTTIWSFHAGQPTDVQ